METAGDYTGASADSSSSTPAAESGAATTIDAGAVTPESQQAAAEGGTGETTESIGQEDGAVVEDDKKGHQKTLEERAEEIADRKVQQRIAESEARRNENQAAQPDFVPVDYDRYDTHIATLISTERQLQEELSLGAENPVTLVREIRKVQQERQSLENSFQANEVKRQEWENRNQMTQQQQQFFQQTQNEINREVAGVASSRNIAPEVVAASRQFIMDAFSKDKVLQSKFDNIVSHKTMYQGFSGVPAAVEWAISYANENMGKAAAAERQRRDAGKDTTLGGAGSGATTGSVGSYTAWLNLPTAQMNQFVKDHPKQFEALKEKHFR